MVQFRIREFNGKYHEKHFVVLAKNRLIDEWIFVKSFLSYKHATDFISYLKCKISIGDFSCLSLKS